MRSAPLLALALAATLAAAPAARAQSGGALPPARLEITAVGDSTLTLRRTDAGWLRAGQRGIVVDPRQGDALVARIRLLSVSGDSAVALLTGLTSPVTRQHVALVDAPRQRWFARGLFWSGLALGAAFGAVVGASF